MIQFGVLSQKYQTYFFLKLPSLFLLAVLELSTFVIE